MLNRGSLPLSVAPASSANSNYTETCGPMIGLFRTRQRRDPIIGSQDGTLDFKVPKRPIRKTIKGLPAFTTVRGGACFHSLPGIAACRYLAGLEGR